MPTSESDPEQSAVVGPPVSKFVTVDYGELRRLSEMAARLSASLASTACVADLLPEEASDIALAKCLAERLSALSST